MEIELYAIADLESLVSEGGSMAVPERIDSHSGEWLSRTSRRIDGNPGY